MAKTKAAHVNEQQQGTEQNQGGQDQVNEQGSVSQASADQLVGNGVEESVQHHTDNGNVSDKAGVDNDPNDYSASLIRQEGQGLRDVFAMAALQGLLANGTHMMRPDAVAFKAYEYADAMLAVRGE